MTILENEDFFRIYQKLGNKTARIEVNRINKNNWHIANIIVPEEHRQKGIAKNIFNNTLDWADKNKNNLVTNFNIPDKNKLAVILNQNGI